MQWLHALPLGEVRRPRMLASLTGDESRCRHRVADGKTLVLTKWTWALCTGRGRYALALPPCYSQH
eukprot:6190683-Pleurochrysis_carterae.AAC.1